MTNRKAKSRRTVDLDDASAVELELILGLGSEDAELVLAPETRSLDLHPWLLDCVAVQVNCLGHQDEFPRAWDWENVLTLLEPGEELLYVLDHVRGDGNQTGRAFTLWLAVRFPQRQALSAGDLDRRRKRARMIVSQFQRQAFPGSDVRWVDPSELQTLLGFSTGGEQRCVCVSGLPSPRDLEDDRRETERANATRNYQSLNDVAESLVDLRCDYRIAFVIERVEADSLKVRLGQATQLRDAIHPHVRGTVQAGGSRGTNTSTSRSQADGTSRSKQTTDSSGSSDSEQNEDGWAKRAWDGVKNVFHPIRRHSTGPRTEGRTWTRSTSETDGESKTVTVGTSTGISEDANWSESQERLRSMLELADRSLERTVAALHEAHGTGGYRWSAFILADGKNADLISGALVGVLAGSRTKDYPFNRFAVHGAGAELLLGNESLLDLVEEAAPILPLSRACEALLLPEAELPGVRLRRNVFLGRTFSPPEDGQPRVGLGPDAFSALTGEEHPEFIEIPRRDLFRHILVAGTTGSGKTTRVVEILNNLEDDHLSVIVFETAKRTYRKRLQRAGRPAPLVYSLGSSRDVPGDRYRPLRLNPFFFEVGTSLKRHIAVLSDALAELMPTEAMIAPLMRKAVEASYVERGWDIERGLPTRDRSGSWPSVLDFAAHVRQVAQTLNYGPEVTANYRGALESRAALFVDATFQDIFAHGGNVPVDELFPVGHDAIVEVEDLPPSEVDIRAFVMTLLLSRLRAVQAARGSQPLASESSPRLLEAPATPSEPDGEHATTLRRAVDEHLRSLGRYAKADRKRLFKSGDVSVNGVVATDGDRRLSHRDRVVVGGVQIWPRIDGLASSSPIRHPVPSEATLREHPVQVAAGPRRWLVVVEEAHNVLDRSFEVRRPADESNAGRTLLRCIDRLLQEGRGMELGVMVIDQSPASLARSVISNTGTKIVMRLEDGAEMEEIGRALGLEEEAWKKLGYLQEGEAIIKASFMDAPVKTARFNNTTSGPSERDRTEAGTVPRYAELGGLWSGVLTGVRRPDDAWLQDTLTAADGRVDLAAFVGVKGILEQHRNDAEILAKTRELRTVLAADESRGSHLLDAARETFKRSVVVANYRPLLDVARLMFRALVKPAAADPAIRVTGVGIQRAADLMALAGLGNPETWRALLLGLSGRPGLRWQDACGRFAGYCNEVGRSDATTPVRVLLLSAETARSTIANGYDADPVELVLHAQALLQPLIELGPQIEEQAVTQRWQVLADHAARELALDMASRHGEGVRSAVAVLLNVEATSDA
jgi:DNA helicase HerA-like ATPase